MFEPNPGGNKFGSSERELRVNRGFEIAGIFCNNIGKQQWLIIAQPLRLAIEAYWLLKQRVLLFQWLAHLNNKNIVCK